MFSDLLILLGYGPTPSIKKENNAPNTLESGTTVTEKPRKVTFQENPETVRSPTPPHTSTGGSAGRQLVPGLLLVHTENSNSSKSFSSANKSVICPQTTATIAKELLNTGSSPTGDTIAANSNQQNQKVSGDSTPEDTPTSSSFGDVVRQKDQLMYLAQLLGFQVSSGPKKRKLNFLPKAAKEVFCISLFQFFKNLSRLIK